MHKTILLVEQCFPLAGTFFSNTFVKIPIWLDFRVQWLFPHHLTVLIGIGIYITKQSGCKIQCDAIPYLTMAILAVPSYHC